MKTILDQYHELELEGLRYDGKVLVAEVVNLFVGERHNVQRGSSRLEITFSEPIAHALTEEFPAAAAALISGSDTGFLRVIENDGLRAALGLDIESYNDDCESYALITAHEILVVFSSSLPVIHQKA